MYKNLKIEYNKEIIEKFKDLHIAADHIGSVLFVLLALDEKRIDLLDIIDDENKARRMLILYKQLEKRALICSGDEQLFELTKYGEELVQYIRSQFEMQQEIVHANNFQQFIEQVMDKKSKAEINILQWIGEYNETFPKGKRNNVQILAVRMNDFLKQFQYSPQIIINAAKMYNKYHDDEGTSMQYRRFAQYFIFEGKGSSRTWDLATWCDKVIENNNSQKEEYDTSIFDSV